MKNRRNELIYEWLVFIKIVEKKSFSAVASEMNVTVSSISKVVARLEGMLNQKLLKRDARKIEVTPQGKITFEKAVSICEKYFNLLAGFERMNECIEGEMRLSAPSIICEEIASEWIMEYMHLNPGATIHLLSRDSGNFTIESPEFDDIVIKSGYIKCPDLIHKKIKPVSLGMYAAPHYLSKHLDLENPAMLESHSVIRLDHPFISDYISLSKAGEIYEVNFSFAHETISNNVNCLIKMSLAGFGICIAVPCWLADKHVKSGNLVQVLPEWDIPLLETHLVWRHRSTYSPLFESFKSYIEMKWGCLFGG